MNDYKLSKKYLVSIKSLSKGTQEKYYKEGFYYKTNLSGNEGFTEYLCSRVLCNSTIRKNLFVKYEYCKINSILGCRSKSFLGKDEEFITIENLYKRVTGKNSLSDYLSYLSNSTDRLGYILYLVSNFVNVSHYKNYLGTLMQLDLLIQNTDRHTHNYGLIYNSSLNTFRIPPIFDNGKSLDTDRTGNKSSCTISGSFEEQVVTFGYPVKPYFKIDYSKLNQDLRRIEKTYGKDREIEILRERLNEYSYLFKI